jgi:hypothetical protein
MRFAEARATLKLQLVSGSVGFSNGIDFVARIQALRREGDSSKLGGYQ